MKRFMRAVVTAGIVAAGAGVGAHRGQALPPPLIKEGVTQKIADLAEATMRTLQDELQGRYNRGQMASAVRAACNEAQ